MTDQTSLSLLERAQDGSERAWSNLHAAYQPFIKKVLGRELDGATAEEISQEVMLVLVRKLPEFERQRPGSFRSWLRKVVRYQLLDHWKAKKRQPDPAASRVAEELDDRESPLSRVWNEQYDRHVVRQLLESVAAEFHPQTMEAFRLVQLEQRDVGEVAAELKMTPGAVRVAKSRVLKALKREGAGLFSEWARTRWRK